LLTGDNLLQLHQTWHFATIALNERVSCAGARERMITVAVVRVKIEYCNAAGALE
jgi:hypothetical protein